MKAFIKSYEDLDVYQMLFQLHLDVHNLTRSFPKFELFELGSQLRRSSNSISANISEGWNNRHLNIYLEGINRAFGELRETRHHLKVAFRKKYLTESLYNDITARYDACARMLKSLEHSLNRYRV